VGACSTDARGPSPLVLTWHEWVGLVAELTEPRAILCGQVDTGAPGPASAGEPGDAEPACTHVDDGYGKSWTTVARDRT
jgi:hypothetical protein